MDKLGAAHAVITAQVPGVQPNIDFVNAFILLFTVFVPPSLAQLFGVYTAIVICSFIGAGWSVLYGPKRTRSETLQFFVLMTLTATAITVTATQLISHIFKLEHIETSMFGGVALIVAGVGRSWPGYIKDFYRRFMAARLPTAEERSTPMSRYPGVNPQPPYNRPNPPQKPTAPHGKEAGYGEVVEIIDDTNDVRGANAGSDND